MTNRDFEHLYKRACDLDPELLSKATSCYAGYECELVIRFDDDSVIVYDGYYDCFRGARPDEFSRSDRDMCMDMFSANLRERMRMRGLTRTDVIDKTGISLTKLNGYMCGTKFPDYYHLIKLSHLFDCSIRELTSNIYS